MDHVLLRIMAGVDAKRGDRDKHHESNCSCVVKSIALATTHYNSLYHTLLCSAMHYHTLPSTSGSAW